MESIWKEERQKPDKIKAKQQQTNKKYITAGTVPFGFMCVIRFVGRVYISYGGDDPLVLIGG